MCRIHLKKAKEIGSNTNSYEQTKQTVESLGAAMMNEDSGLSKEDFIKSQKQLEGAVLKNGDGQAVFKSYVVTHSRTGSQISFVIDYTNTNDDINKSFYHMKSQIKLYQDGAELTTGYSRHDKDESTQLRNGTTIEVITTYNLRNETSDVELECYEPDKWGFQTGERASAFTIKIQ